MKFDHRKIQSNIALNLIEKIEDKTGEMFHETHPELANVHMDCMDGKISFSYLNNELYKIIDELS